MITALVGTPGSGKSYDAVQMIVSNLRKGRQVWTNIDGMQERKCIEAIKVMTGLDDYEISENFHFMENWLVNEFWKHVPNKALIVIDECHKNFNARNWQAQQNNECAAWASTHRHTGNDVILITQSIEKMDKQLRDLIEWTYHYKKNNFMGKFAENMYLRYAYMEGGTDGKPLKVEKRFYKKEIFACYKSYVSGDIKELGITARVNILKHPVFLVIPCVIAFFLYMFFFKSSLGTGDLFGQKSAQAAQEKAIKQIKDKDKKVVVTSKNEVEILNASGSVNAPVPVVLPPGKKSDDELQRIEDERLDREQPTWRDESYYEDESGIRHYLDGRKVQMVYR